MNGMKRINDRYGHVEGDFCLRAIAEAMHRSALLEEICIRTGGDEFVVLAKNYDRQKEEAFVSMVRENISSIMKQAGKKYSISVSIGCCRSIPDPAGTATIQSEAEQYIKSADQAMYQEKHSPRK